MVKFLLPLLVSLLVQTSHACWMGLTDQRTGSHIIYTNDPILVVLWDVEEWNDTRERNDTRDPAATYTMIVNDELQAKGPVELTDSGKLPNRLSLGPIKFKDPGDVNIVVTLFSGDESVEFPVFRSFEVQGSFEVLPQPTPNNIVPVIKPQITSIGMVALTNQETNQRTEITDGKTTLPGGFFNVDASGITWDFIADGDEYVAVMNVKMKLNGEVISNGTFDFTMSSGVPQTDTISFGTVQLKDFGNNSIVLTISSDDESNEITVEDTFVVEQKPKHIGSP